MSLFNAGDKVVIKIGSSLLIQDGKVKINWLNNFVQDVLYLNNLGVSVVIVSSGSIALGRNRLNLKHPKLTISERQASAAIGQIILIGLYKNYFKRYKINVAQLLITNSQSRKRNQYLNISNCLDKLIKNNIVPIINENDSISSTESIIGDNDRLSARISQMINANLLILLSDVDGLYNKNPKLHFDAKFIPVVDKVTQEIENMASGVTSKVGTGGMVTKIEAIKMASNSNCDTIITNGIVCNPIRNILKKKRYTIFKSYKTKTNSKKRWIINSINIRGEVVINKNAERAIKSGYSLLSVGVISFEGDFKENETILVKDDKGKHIATGLSYYSSKDVKLILGKNTTELRLLLGLDRKDELIHRDNLVFV